MTAATPAALDLHGEGSKARATLAPRFAAAAERCAGIEARVEAMPGVEPVAALAVGPLRRYAPGMDPSSATLGARIFDVAWKVVGAGVALLAGAMVLSAVRSMLRGEMRELDPIYDPRKLAAPPLALTALDGTRLDLAGERGRAVLLVSFDARETEPKALADLAERARAAGEATGGAARVWALVSNGLVLKDGSALGPLPPVALVPDPERKVAAGLEAHIGRIGAWWIVDRKGLIELRGEPQDWPRYQAFRRLRLAAEP